MPHVVTQPCCSDASCVWACPVNCIQPTPDDPGFAAAEMLHIDPVTCVDCGACVPACPVEAIKPSQKLAPHEHAFLELSREYHREPRPRPLLAPPPPRLTVRARDEPLRVAVVGSGPAGMYAADEILTIPRAQVDVYERLPQPYGLARLGVAPDHRRTRRVTRQFEEIRRQRGLTLLTGVEVGHDVSHEELLAGHHAVIYAVGASADRPLALPGVGLPGTASATEVVAWYNGHPDGAARSFDFSGRRAVVIGNGNVALDVARILTLDPDRLAETDIAPAALAALRESHIEEVLVVGRRAPQHAAFTLPELIGLASTPGIEVTVDPDELAAAPASATLTVLRELGSCRSARRRRRIVLRFELTPIEVHGAEHTEAIALRRTSAPGEELLLPTGLVLTSIGYRGLPIPDLPFDETRGVVPNARGRVLDPHDGAPVPGAYVAGWIKRGPSGFIGTNRLCSLETVQALAEDWGAGRLVSPARAASGHSVPSR
jgi:ferredoxin--NADP+ reductase